MAQPEPKDKVTLESVFKLIEQLAPDEQQQLGQTLNKLQALRDAVDVGIKQLDQGLGIPADAAFDQLLARYCKK
jgi:phage-related protein